MHALIVLAHPEQKSFNSQLARLGMEELRHQGYTVETSDLCRMNFDPLERACHYRDQNDPDWLDPQAQQKSASETGSLPQEVSAEISKLVFRIRQFVPSKVRQKASFRRRARN